MSTPHLSAAASLPLDPVRRLDYLVRAQEAGLSLAAYLSRQGFSQKRLVQLKQGNLQVNGSFHRMIDPLAAGDEVSLICPSETSHLQPNPGLAVPVIYEDEDLIIYNKPANMPIHPSARHFDDSLGNYFVFCFPQHRFRPIGRLDRDTTGLCLIAKHGLAAAKLNGQVSKKYFAIAQGLLPLDQGIIDAPLLRVGGEKISRQIDPGGQKALTHYQVLRRHSKHTLLLLTLMTGRTHQIRAHLAYLGFPLAGDGLYGGDCDLICRQALHCGSLSFCHPISNRAFTLNAPLPKDMLNLLGDCAAKPSDRL